MTAQVYTATTIGFEGKLIEVECDASKGLPTLQIVGLGNKAIDEARERVRSAITNSNLDFPTRRITINLAPANLPKNGADFDLPIAIAILLISKQLKAEEISESLFAGELALNGQLRPIRNAISIVETARAHGLKRVFLPLQNVAQASLIEGVVIVGIQSLAELFLHLKGEKKVTIAPIKKPRHVAPVLPTISDIYGQEQAKRALTIAATGHHNILFTGPPGAGKTMLAKALANLLPPLSIEEQIIVTKIHNLAGLGGEEIMTSRPFRAPHHTASYVSLIGGGNAVAKPGEVSLAHLGVLFLDELPEYPRSSLEALRQPLEDHQINIARANSRITFPAHFMLVATKNPCPCGYFGDTTRECSCRNSQITAYQKRLSGPLLDRIDMIISVARVDHRHLLEKKPSHNTEDQKLHERITQARNRQKTRYGDPFLTNASINNHFINQYLTLSNDVKHFLASASEKLQLTARSHFKIIKVARSIADFDNCQEITTQHVSEALQFRSL